MREGRKAGQRIVRHIGVAESEAGVAKLLELGEIIKVEVRCERQPSLVPQETLVDLAVEVRREKAKTGPPVVIEKTREERRVVTGFHEACGAVYRQLGFDDLLPAKNRSAREALRHMVTARIANPRSKRGASRRLESELGVSIPVQKIYRMMDRLDKDAIDTMKDLAAGAARKLLPEPASVVFFDCTTLHFESVEADGLREFGFSKNGRHGRTQVLLALMAASDGLSIGCEVFPRSVYEGKSLIPALDNAGTRKDREGDPRRRPGHVRRGESQDHGRAGSPVHRRRPAEIIAERLEGEDPRPRRLQLDRRLRGFAFGEFEHKGRRIVVGWSRKRAKKDAAKREIYSQIVVHFSLTQSPDTCGHCEISMPASASLQSALVCRGQHQAVQRQRRRYRGDSQGTPLHSVRI